MAVYLNPDNRAFDRLRSSEYYVDRSLIINDITKMISGHDKYLCVSRPPRFGKTSDACLLAAYYSKGCDSSALFDDLKIVGSKDYKKHLNQHNVIFINIKDAYSLSFYIKDMISLLSQTIMEEIKDCFEKTEIDDKDDLGDFLEEFGYHRDEQFIFIIDEWDYPFRDERILDEEMKDYIGFLTALLKDHYYVSFVYMTGILPIKKSGMSNDLDMFRELTMASSHPFGHFMGFTEEEVKTLCFKNHIDYNMIKQWYGGYLLDNEVRIYCPYIIIKTLFYRRYYVYWNQTENYLILKKYLSLDYQDIEGIQGDVIKLLIGEKVHISPYRFKNDMIHIESNNDVLSLLVHLGYLAINIFNEAYIPCFDVFQLFKNVISHLHWKETENAFKNSSCLYEWTWNKDGQKVGNYIEIIHHDLGELSYWDDDCLLYSLELAYLDFSYYQSRKIPISDKGRKVLFYPSSSDKPSLVFELVWQALQDRDDGYLEDLKGNYDKLLLISLLYKETVGYEYCLESCHIKSI